MSGGRLFPDGGRLPSFSPSQVAAKIISGPNTKTASQAMNVVGWRLITDLTCTFTANAAKIYILHVEMILNHGGTLHTFGAGYSFDGGTSVMVFGRTSGQNADSFSAAVPFSGLSGAQTIGIYGHVDASSTSVYGSVVSGAATYGARTWVTEHP